jgi:hypothetical protein
MLLPNTFKEILATRGRDLREIGLDEVALSKRDALDAIQSLEGHQIAVLGGDVYFEEGGRIRPRLHNWFCEKQPNEHPFEFTKRSQIVALNFVQGYDASLKSNAFFVLVVSELGVVGL